MANLLFIFEGESTEFQIVESLTKHYVNEKDKIVIKTAFCNDVYELYKEVSEDTDLDTFELIRNISANVDTLKEYSRNDFAEIYLFFDYDGHDDQADDKLLLKLLDFFNEETDKGKIYISYPMIESIKHIPKETHFKDLKVAAKENTHYKKMVHEETEKGYQNLSKYSREKWNFLIVLHIKKANYIVENKFILPIRFIGQAEILQSQIDKFIKVSNTVSILNSFPMFVLDYYGLNLIRKIAS